MNILDFFSFDPVGKRLEDLETPVPVIDIDVVDRNLRRWQDRCDRLGIANRPDIKDPQALYRWRNTRSRLAPRVLPCRSSVKQR